MALDAGAFSLVAADGDRMPATSDSLHDELRVVRFNVMAGPAQMPLAPGRWTLTVSDDEGRSWPAAPAGDLRAGLDEMSRAFAIPRGTYRVDVSIEPASAELILEITRERHRAGAGLRRPSRRRLRQWWWTLVRPARVGLFRALIRILRLVVPRRGRLIVFTSDSRETLGGNLKIVHDRVVERGLHHEYRLRTIFKPSIRTARSARDRLRLTWLLALADVILLDDYQPAIYRLPPHERVRIIQLWHAWGAFKTVGYSRVGKPGSLSPYSSVHKNYTHAIVSSPYEVPFYAEAFGIPEERVVPTGTPRMDQFLDPERQRQGRAAAVAALPATGGRFVILFAPTFRGGGPRQARYPVGQLDLEALHRLCVELDAVMVFKLHPFVKSRLTIPDGLGDRLVDATRTTLDVNDMLLITDLLITDYSSIVFEYSTLARPMLFYAYDLEHYTATRDFYVPYVDFVPGRIVQTMPELIDAIRRGDYQAEKVVPFAERHLARRDGSATDRIIDQLILDR
ncbi:MAG: CDP-glycerol glycerophosphotransferase family protein [Thermoleophilaceae bacterium]|nr:CDP-glycerol glycerophosphotransferase family protein [Thermoleophilaceae bacterium]